MPPDNRPVDSGPGRDIHRGHPVGVVGEPTRPAHKLRLGSSVAPVDMSAYRTRAGCVLGLDKKDGDARKGGLVGDEGLELSEGPAVVERSPSLLNRCPRPDALEVLKDNRGPVPSGLLHHALCDSVVHGGGKVVLFSGQLPKMPLRRLRAPLLEASSEAGVAKANPREVLAGEALARAVRGQVHLAEVYAQNAFGVYAFGVVYLANHGQVELPLTNSKPRGKFSDRALKEAKLRFSRCKWHPDAALEGRNGDRSTLRLKTENAAVVADCPKLLEGVHGLPRALCFVCVHHPVDDVDGELGGESKARSDLSIDEGVEGLPAKGPLLEGHLRGIIAGRVHSPNRVEQSLCLRFIRQKLDYCCQPHIAQPVESIPYEKGGARGPADSLLGPSSVKETRFRLESLLQFADQLVDLLTLELSALERSLLAAREAAADVSRRLRHERAAVLKQTAEGGFRPPEVASVWAYLERLERKAAELKESAAALEAAVARKRDELLAAEKERRMLLKLKEEFEAAVRAELNRRHQQFLDELAGGRHFRSRHEG